MKFAQVLCGLLLCIAVYCVATTLPETGLRRGSHSMLPKPAISEVPKENPQEVVQVENTRSVVLPLANQNITAMYYDGSKLYVGTSDGVLSVEDNVILYEEGSGDLGAITAFAEFGGTLYAAASSVDKHRTGGILREEDGVWYVHTRTNHSVNTFALRYAGRERPLLVAGTESGLYELLDDDTWRRVYPGGHSSYSTRVSAYAELTTSSSAGSWTYDCMGTKDDGIVCTQQDDPTRVVRFTAKIWGDHGLDGDAITQLKPISYGSNTLLVTMADGGLGTITIQKENRYETNSVAQPVTGLPARSVYSIREDDDGSLWVAGNDGVYRAERLDGEWELIDTRPSRTLEFYRGLAVTGTSDGLVFHKE